MSVAGFFIYREFSTREIPAAPMALSATATEKPSPVPSNTSEPTKTPSQEITPTELALDLTMSPTSTPLGIPAPETYVNEIVVFDNKLTSSSLPLRLCWREDILPSDVRERESFFRLNDYDWWAFGIDGGRESDLTVQANLHKCIGDQPVGAMVLNTWVTHLEPERDGVSAGEFGMFLEDQNGNRREYTLWIDRDARIHLQVLENGEVTDDNVVSIVNLGNLERDGNPANDYYKFPIQIFLEMNNQGQDIIYLQEQLPPYRAVQALDLTPDQMVRIDYAVRPALGDIQKIGLVGRGGYTEVLIWPLAFFERDMSN